MHTCKVKLNRALDAKHTSCSMCDMKLKQNPGEEKLLISKQKAITLGCLIDVPPTPTPANYFLIFFHPGHSYSNLLPINYWEKFPNQKNVLKQYSYADFFAIAQKEWPRLYCVLFVGFCKEANTLWFAL